MTTPGRPSSLSIGTTAIGAVLMLAGAIVDPPRAAAAYLTAYVSCLAVVLGALAMIMIAHVTTATWFVALRRQAEQIVATLPLFAVLLIPLLIITPALYPWARADAAIDPLLRGVIHAKAAYLNRPFFVVRAIIYFATWIWLGSTLRRASLAQDRGDSRDIERRLMVVCSVGLVAFALTVSFAAFDWMMSLTPAWYSTIYGVYYFAGGMVGALALLAVIIARERRRGILPADVGADHFHALAKLLITFVLFWVYIGFSQLIVIWSAEIPAERVWYVPRMRGGWEALGALLVVGHFALPFCALLVRAIKRSALAMTCIGLWLLLMHYFDVYWVVMPDAPRGSGWGYWIDAGALLLIGGLGSMTWAMRRTAEPAIPIGDPRISESLEYSTD
jgi:hypothetical protein